MNPVLAAILAAGAAAGVVLIVAGWRAPQEVSRPRRSTRPRRRMPRLLTTRRDRVLAVVGLVAGILMAALQGWVIALLVLPAAAVGVPKVLSAPPDTDIDRLEALEEWTRSLSGVVGHTMLQSAIIATLPSAPAAISAELTQLVARLHAGRPLAAALYAFADDLDDQTGDYIAASLIQASEAKSAGLRLCLDAIASDVAREVRARREIRTAQRAAFTNARWVVAIVVPLVIGVVFFTGFGAPYRTPVGQVLLAGLTVAFGACLVWLRARSTFRPAPRFLITPRRLG